MSTTKKKRGPKGKYVPELVSRMLQIIEQTGQDKPAYKSVGLTAETFYKWMREKPELSGSVARAREAFYSRDDEEIINRCREALIRHLGIHEENWTSEETTTLPDGSTVVKKSDRSVMKPPSEWAVKLVTPMLSGLAPGVEHHKLEVMLRERLESEVDGILGTLEEGLDPSEFRRVASVLAKGEKQAI